jgi:hypothetical protein
MSCPGCQLPFGPISKYLTPPGLSPSDPMNVITLKLPELPSFFSYIVFECHFYQKVGCNLIGDGPTIVENVLETQLIFDPGVLLHSQGDYAQCLIDRGLYASIGDIFLAVDGKGIGHLGYTEVIRLINRRFASIRESGVAGTGDGARISVIFRRHYIQAVTNTYRSASLTRQPNFAASMRNFDNHATTPQVKYMEPGLPANSTAALAKVDPSTPQPYQQMAPYQLGIPPQVREFEEYKAPSEPYSYPGSEIQYPTASMIATQEEESPMSSLAYPALPGVATTAPSRPLQYPVATPLEQINLPLPSRVEANAVPLVSSPISLLPTEEEEEKGIDQVPEISVPSPATPTSEVHASPHPPLATATPSDSIQLTTGPPAAIHHEQTIAELPSPTPVTRSAPIFLVPDEVLLDLPEAPSGNPVFFPDAPTHVIFPETAASARGLDASEPEPIERSDRTVAMSGRNLHSSSLPPAPAPAPAIYQQQPASPSIPQDASAYPTLPSVPSARALSAPSVDLGSGSPYRSASISVRLFPSVLLCHLNPPLLCAAPTSTGLSRVSSLHSGDTIPSQ